MVKEYERIHVSTKDAGNIGLNNLITTSPHNLLEQPESLTTGAKQN